MCLSGQTTSFVATKVCLPRQTFCCDQIMFDKTFVVTSILSSQQKMCFYVFVTTKESLSQQNFCCNKIMFVATNIILNKSFVATKLCLSRQILVSTKDVFCRNKHMFDATKIILVAAPINDTGQTLSFLALGWF